ncbi:MAG: hypothetical protein JW749_06405 [Sedimentisphaerales bacterium]|nr:hypothetical protein [Sedimentisphaerales bacterium]
MEHLTDLQHSLLLQTISSLHVHLDSRDYIEVIILKDKAGAIHRMADMLICLKGVKPGRINLPAPEGL